MRAIFIAVGSEMLDQERVDTNSLYVARKLMEKGILLNMKVVVGDDMENLRWIIKQACKRAQLVIISGGLGPTEDDITREATANALKKELIFKEELVESIRERFRIRGINMPDINTRQAFVIADAEILPNPRGTAPGLSIVMMVMCSMSTWNSFRNSMAASASHGRIMAAMQTPSSPRWVMLMTALAPCTVSTGEMGAARSSISTLSTRTCM